MDNTAKISLHDYFIAHAPDKPHPWFKPVMPPRPVSVFMSDDGKKKFFTYESAERECGEDGFHDLSWDEIVAWEKENTKQRYVQWPAAWADEMLKERARIKP